MTSERWQKVKGLFDAVVELAPEQRKQFLDHSCGTDAPLRREVETLLASFAAAESFMEQPAAKEVASLIIEPTEKLEQGRCFGHYEIIEQLGAGGMGEVYLARDKKLDRQVAVKILNEKFARHEANLRRFTQEAKAASALNHPNILVIHEIAECDDMHYIVSEFVAGKTLREMLKQAPLKLAEVLDISLQIANALVAAHTAHIVHRDIKPENIIVRPDGFVKMLDFGLAKLVAYKPIGFEETTVKQNQTAQGVILGTISYMSPEQAKGEKIDERTDIFSFGVVLYEMLSGKLPFAGDSTSDVIASILKTEPASLARYDVPKELARIVNKALRKNADERYQHSKDLLLDLKDFKQDSEFEAKLERQKFAASSASADGFDFNQNANAKTPMLEVNSTAGASDETATANVAARPTAKHAGQLRRIFPTRRAVIYTAVLLTLMLGALAYSWHWRQTSVAPQAEIKSLAVLPLKSLDAGENYLGLGIADAVIRRINQTGKLIVRPTSAVRRYLNEDTDALTAARQLNADAVLEGSVQRADERLRVSVNLLRTGDGASLWADNFDMRMTDIFTMQDTVAQQVAARLRLQLDPSQQARFTKRYTSNPIAYEFYLKGVYRFDQRDGWGDKAKPQAEATIDLFKKAIAADPNYALAHAQLAYAYAWTAQFIDPTEPVWAERAKEEINRAQTLDSQLAETHVARHYILRSAYEGWQIEAAIRELLLAQQLNPNTGHDQLGILYLHIGLEDLYEREMQRALDIDPTSEYVKTAIINSYVNRNMYDERLAAQQKFFNGKPDAWYLMGKGRLDEAQTRIEQALAQEPDNLDGHRLKAILLALRGDFRAAAAEIPFLLSKRPVKNFAYHHLAYDIACVYALAGKSDEAVKWLRETAATGFPCYPLFERDPYLHRIRQAPEFSQFMAEMKAQFEKYKREFAATP